MIANALRFADGDGVGFVGVAGVSTHFVQAGAERGLALNFQAKVRLIDELLAVEIDRVAETGGAFSGWAIGEAERDLPIGRRDLAADRKPMFVPGTTA